MRIRLSQRQPWKARALGLEQKKSLARAAGLLPAAVQLEVGLLLAAARGLPASGWSLPAAAGRLLPAGFAGFLRSRQGETPRPTEQAQLEQYASAPPIRLRKKGLYGFGAFVFGLIAFSWI